MKAQDIAVGVSKSVSGVITVNCDCGDHSHNHTVIVNSEDGLVTVNVYTQSYTKFKYTDFYTVGFWKGIMERVKQASSILFKGYSEYESELVLDKQAALNYATALTNAIKEEEKNGEV